MASRFIWEKLLFGFVFLLSCGVATGQTQELVFFNWSEHLDSGLVKEFKAQHNIKLKEVFCESNDERDTLLIDSNGEGFDLAIVNGAMLSMYEHRDWLATPNKTAEKYLPSDFLSDPVIYPGASQLQNSEVYLELTPRSIRQHNQVVH